MTVEELLKKEKIDFIPSGRDFLVKCFNPEHEDTNPSMRVDKVLGIFHCLSCGYKGNLFKYFDESVDKSDSLREELRRKIQNIRIESVGLQMPKLAMPIEVKYRVSLETLLEFEAFTCSEKEYENRVIFPIRDVTEKIVAFIGRNVLGSQLPKYMIYPKGAKLPLFPLHKMTPHNGRVILVEGIFDLLKLWDNGFKNVVCSFGTNAMTKYKLELLQLRGVTGLDILFDNDKAGKEAASSVADLAKNTFNVRTLSVPSDPGDLTTQQLNELREIWLK